MLGGATLARCRMPRRLRRDLSEHRHYRTPLPIALPNEKIRPALHVAAAPRLANAEASRRRKQSQRKRVRTRDAPWEATGQPGRGPRPAPRPPAAGRATRPPRLTVPGCGKFATSRPNCVAAIATASESSPELPAPPPHGLASFRASRPSAYADLRRPHISDLRRSPSFDRLTYQILGLRRYSARLTNIRSSARRQPPSASS